MWSSPRLDHPPRLHRVSHQPGRRRISSVGQSRRRQASQPTTSNRRHRPAHNSAKQHLPRHTRSKLDSLTTNQKARPICRSGTGNVRDAGARLVGTLALARWIRPAGEPFASSRKASERHGKCSHDRATARFRWRGNRVQVRRPFGTPPVRSCCRVHDAITFNKWSPTPPATNQPRRRRPTRPTTDPTPTAPNTTPTHTQQLIDATQRQRPQPQLPNPRKQRLPSITFKA